MATAAASRPATAAPRAVTRPTGESRVIRWTLTAIALPPDLPPARVRDGLKALGILTAAGLGPYQDFAFRIGHMGDIRETDVQRTLDALGAVLADLRAVARTA